MTQEMAFYSRDLDMWHNEPKNDAWREVHLAHVESLGNRLWLRCNECGHSMTQILAPSLMFTTFT